MKKSYRACWVHRSKEKIQTIDRDIVDINVNYVTTLRETYGFTKSNTKPTITSGTFTRVGQTEEAKYISPHVNKDGSKKTAEEQEKIREQHFKDNPVNR